jgi:hypothetical protein
MALIYHATLTPTKLEMLAGWLPTRTWFAGGTELERLGSYRFDDPAGEVGLEGLLVASDDGGPVLHVPLTYRHAPLAGAEEFLLGTTEHSVLGTRWVYDACGDPVWVRALATTIATGGSQADEVVDTGGDLEARAPSVAIAGSGTAAGVSHEVVLGGCHDDGPTTVVDAGDVELVVARVVGADMDAAHTLTGTWAGTGNAVLAGLRLC